LVAAPRVGFAWNVTGDGRTAIRASTGVFYNFAASSAGSNAGYTYSYTGGCPVSCTRTVQWSTFSALAAASTQGANFVTSPVSGNVGGLSIPNGHSYNANVAFTRDVGFSTVAEIAWVGNYVWN